MRSLFILFCIALFSPSLYAQGAEPKLVVNHLTGDFYVYTTYNYYKESRYPANGMYVVTKDGVLLIDSPWDTTQFQPLLDTIKRRHNKDVVLCIATHFHEDRTAGLEYYRRKGIRTYTTRLTDKLSAENEMKRAEFLLSGDTLMTLGEYSFRVYHPGHGHTPDNIVVWFDKERILYGGCLVKSFRDTTLGNLGDASVVDYPQTIRNVMNRFENPRFVIPGHNDWSSVESLAHTLRMAERQREHE